MSDGFSQDISSTERPHEAGAFDVRNVIAELIGFYGLVLVLVSLFGDKQLDKTGGVNANLWTGLAMLLFAAAFALWSRLRPIVVAPGAVGAEKEDGPDGF
jgi:hypothetical protein